MTSAQVGKTSISRLPTMVFLSAPRHLTEVSFLAEAGDWFQNVKSSNIPLITSDVSLFTG